MAVQAASQRGVRLIQLVLFCRVGGSLIWSSAESSPFLPKCSSKTVQRLSWHPKKRQKENVRIKKEGPNPKERTRRCEIKKQKTASE